MCVGNVCRGFRATVCVCARGCLSHASEDVRFRGGKQRDRSRAACFCGLGYFFVPKRGERVV